MFVKQVSVFLENREGRLEELTRVLKDEQINVLALSMADTTEYGMIRLIVSDPMRAHDALREKGFSARLTDVLALRVEDKVGELYQLTHTLCSSGMNIEYMYTLASGDHRAIIVKVTDGEAAAKAILADGMRLYTTEEMCG